MTQDTIEQVLFGINGKLSSIESKLDSLSQTIIQHEARINNLENTVAQISVSGSGKDGDFKTELLKMGAKCLMIALTVIASLTGACGLLSKLGTF